MSKKQTGNKRAEAGRPPVLDEGQRKNVYLDKTSLDLALEIGGGNISEGIRRALLIAAQRKEKESKK